MQQTQVLQDERRYGHRVWDATSHSRNLQRDFPVDLIKPPLATHDYTGLSVRQEVSSAEHLSLAKFRRRLEEINYEDYGPSAKKKQKLVFEKVNHAREQRKSNQDKFRMLQNELNGRRDQRKIGGTFSVELMEKRSVIKGGKQVATADDSETKEIKPTQSSNEEDKEVNPVLIFSTGTTDESSNTAKSRDEEIAELEEKLRAQRLSCTSEADRLFYNRAEREANTILKEVLLHAIYEISTEAFKEEEEKSRNKELPPELLEIVEDALHEGPMEEVLIQKYNVDITRRHLQCLLPTQWLNDEVINFYFQMMGDRDEALVNAGVLPKRSHFFNSFFYSKVSENGYNFINVRRWTRKIDLFGMDKIFMPVNVGNMHWCMAVIFMSEKRIQYYDSMQGGGAACLKVLFSYLHDESEHKKKQKFDDEGWELVTTTPDTPQQKNGFDCGVFSCMFADYLAQNKPLTFSQKDIPFHRHRMVLHVSRGYIPLEEEGL